MSWEDKVYKSEGIEEEGGPWMNGSQGNAEPQAKGQQFR